MNNAREKYKILLCLLEFVILFSVQCNGWNSFTKVSGIVCYLYELLADFVIVSSDKLFYG